MGVMVAAILGAVTFLYPTLSHRDGLPSRSNDVATSPRPLEGSGREIHIVKADAATSNVPRDVAPARESSTMFNQYADASDLRLFVEESKRRVARGGIFYASAALDECRALKAEIEGSASLADAVKLAASTALAGQPMTPRMRALAVLQGRCANFTADELGVAEQRSMIAWGRAQDPLARLRARLLEGATGLQDPEKRQVLMKELLAVGDPGMLELVRGLAWSSSGELSSIYVDGQAFGGLDGEQFDTAWMLMTCAIAERCGSRGIVVEQNCGLADKCAESLAALLRSRAGSDEEYRKIAAVADRLTQIVLSRQVSALLPMPK